MTGGWVAAQTAANPSLRPPHLKPFPLSHPAMLRDDHELRLTMLVAHSDWTLAFCLVVCKYMLLFRTCRCALL